MNTQRMLGILTLIAASSSTALAEEQSTQNSQPSTALPSLPVFELPVLASDTARQHVGLAHARRDSRRAEHTRAAAATVGAQEPRAHSGPAQHKTAQEPLVVARERRAATRARRNVAELREAEARERRAQAQDRRTSAAEHRAAAAAAAAEHQLNADALRAAAEERRANAGRP